MDSRLRTFAAIAILVLSSLAVARAEGGGRPQASQQPAQPPSILDRLNAMMGQGKSAWTAQQLDVMTKLRDVALNDPYALNELHHLTGNIGPRLSGSPQAQ